MQPNGFDNQSGFLKACSQDPTLAKVKPVAEPWDCGPGGYQVGAFPSQWSEWNDRYRSAMRRYWSGEGSLIGDVSRRMTASADLFDHEGRSPRASVNHITVHDGFTLADLFSYNAKHNFANAEGPFPSKLPSASLNLSTYIALYSYGYENVYELGPLIDVKTSKLELVSSATDR